MGDCSRILANFYLRKYDLYIEQLCGKYGAKRVRYADDHILFAPNKEIANRLLFESSKALHAIGLNINTSKVKCCNSSQEFEQYWCFNEFKLLDNPSKLDLESVVKKYLIHNDLMRNDGASLLKRILNIGLYPLSNPVKQQLLIHLKDEDFIKRCNYKYMIKLVKCVDNKDELLQIFKKIGENTLFNSYLYNLRKFYQKNGMNDELSWVTERIEELGLLK